MYRAILVPLDGSHFAEQALPLAVSLARRAGCELQLVYVHPAGEESHPEHRFLNEETWTTEWKTRHGVYLDALAQQIRSGGQVTVKTYVHQGEVAPTIHQHVVDQQVDLVVMTTHARGAVTRMWLGSVADQLVRELPRPVLLVRPVAEKPSLTDEVSLNHVLIPLDGSPLAEQIFDAAGAIGEVMDVDYTLLRVIRPVTPTHYPMDGINIAPLPEAMLEQLERTGTEARQRAQEYLDEAAQRMRDRLLRVRTRVEEHTQPAIAIIDLAEKLPADLIAMQTHGRQGISRLILGSVADKILRGATVPLLVQRPAK